MIIIIIIIIDNNKLLTLICATGKTLAYLNEACVCWVARFDEFLN